MLPGQRGKSGHIQTVEARLSMGRSQIGQTGRRRTGRRGLSGGLRRRKRITGTSSALSATRGTKTGCREDHNARCRARRRRWRAARNSVARVAPGHRAPGRGRPGSSWRRGSPCLRSAITPLPETVGRRPFGSMTAARGAPPGRPGDARGSGKHPVRLPRAGSAHTGRGSSWPPRLRATPPCAARAAPATGGRANVPLPRPPPRSPPRPPQCPGSG